MRLAASSVPMYPTPFGMKIFCPTHPKNWDTRPDQRANYREGLPKEPSNKRAVIPYASAVALRTLAGISTICKKSVSQRYGLTKLGFIAADPAHRAITLEANGPRVGFQHEPLLALHCVKVDLLLRRSDLHESFEQLPISDPWFNYASDTLLSLRSQESPIRAERDVVTDCTARRL
jgi:hypothetical protein